MKPAHLALTPFVLSLCLGVGSASAEPQQSDAENAAFEVFDEGDDPLAGYDLDDLLEDGAIPGRVVAVRKKGGEQGDGSFEFEDDEEPEAEEEFGFDFEFEGQAEPEDPVENFDFEPMDDPDEDPLGELEGVPEDKPAPKKPEPAATGSASAAATPAIQLDVVGKTPLADNYEPAIVAYDRDSVVLELPVLLGRSRADFDGIAYCIVAEVFADGNKVAEARQQVTSASLAEFGPSFAFVKLLAPVTAKSGKLEVRLSKASTMSGQPTQLFSRTISYQLP